MKDRSIISVRDPSVSLKKDSSSLKKADPRNVALMRKYAAVATIPTGRDWSVARLMYTKATVRHEVIVKKCLGSELIADSMLLSLKE